MAKDKERSINPAQQQRKLDKAKAVKKGKAELQARRNEKLARRNPDRLQRQIDDLKALEQSGSIKTREKQILQDLEKDLRAVRKARETLGDKAPRSGNSSRPNRNDGDRKNDSVLGKRNWNGERKGYGHESSGSETDESVRKIPMPRDTPPPPPRRYRAGQGSGANMEPVNGSRDMQHLPSSAAPVFAPAQTTYESAPQIRDLRKEAVQKFVPSVVRKKLDAARGVGGLVEPEELDRLEQEGYGAGQAPESNPTIQEEPPVSGGQSMTESRVLEEEEARFRKEMKHVQIEDMEDEDM